MTTTLIGSKRHPRVAHRRVPLTERQRELQLQRGLWATERGERLALPVDRLSDRTVFLDRKLWRRTPGLGVHRPGVKAGPPVTHWQRRVLTFLRDHVDESIPSRWYYLVLGHDVHVSVRGDLHAQHWHRGWADPFTGEQEEAPDPSFGTLRRTHWVDHECRLETCPAQALGPWETALSLLGSEGGFVEHCGWLSGGKVTDAFVSEEVDELFSATASEYADFDFHEVGTSTQAENNNDTALIVSSGIARATGTPTDADPIYRNAGTITGDATEIWEEHLLSNNLTGPSALDRSLTGGQAVNAADQVTYTHSLTKNPEA